METKVEKFKQKIRQKQERMILYNRFGKATVNGWIYTKRVPIEANAKIISALLGVPLVEVPYYRVEHVI